MTRAALIALLFAMSACGASDPDHQRAGQSDTRQIPSNTTPGVHISGHVNVGVVRNF